MYGSDDMQMSMRRPIASHPLDNIPLHLHVMLLGHVEIARVDCYIGSCQTDCSCVFLQASAVVQLVGAEGVSGEYVLGAL